MRSVLQTGLLACLVLLPAPLPACEVSDDTDCARAIERAKQLGRPLLLAFIGTDWSFRSLKLDREVLDQPAFADDAKYNFLLCKLHFYQTQERPLNVLRQNQELAERYGVEQFPTIVVLSPEGREIGRLGYVEGGVGKFGGAVNALIAGRPGGS